MTNTSSWDASPYSIMGKLDWGDGPRGKACFLGDEDKEKGS